MSGSSNKEKMWQKMGKKSLPPSDRATYEQESQEKLCCGYSKKWRHVTEDGGDIEVYVDNSH